MKLTIKTDFADVQRKLDRLQDDIAKRVTVRTVNKVADQAKVRMTRAITQEFNMDRQLVRQKLAINYAMYRQGRFEIQAELLSMDQFSRFRSTNLIHFVEKSISLAEARRRAKSGTLKDLRVKVLRSGGSKRVPGAFIGNKGRTMFMRVPGTKMKTRQNYRGTHAEQIRPVQTIDVQAMFKTRRVNNAVVAAIKERLPIVFEQELKFALNSFR